MSIISEDKYSAFEYNPCIRKGKHKSQHKIQKKYKAKVQKTNLIRPKRYKIVSEICDTVYNNKELFNELLIILKDKNIKKWNDDCELLYNQVFRLENDVELQKYYLDIQTDIEKERIEYEEEKWYTSREGYWCMNGDGDLYIRN